MGRFRSVELGDLRLHGERLSLRPWRADDAPRVHEIMQDPSLPEILDLPAPYTRDDADRFVTGGGHQERADGSGLACAVTERDGGRLVGSAVLYLTDPQDIGYWIARDAQGRGYATEAIRLLAGWAFEHGQRRVTLRCDVGNVASLRTALAAGFRFEGVARASWDDQAAGHLHPQRTDDMATFARLAEDSDDAVAPAFPPLPRRGLEDGVVGLRVPRAGDAQALLETDDELTLRWSFDGRAHTFDEARRSAGGAALQWLVGGVASFAMIDLETDAVAGMLNVRKAGPPQVGGVGYVVHPAFRGRGYTTRALRMLIRWAFDIADFARLELGAKVGNDASLRAAASAGFEPDGVRSTRLRKPDGSFSDEVRLALVNPRYLT